MMLETINTECKGLTSSDAARLLRAHGRNEIEHAHHLEAFAQLLSFFVNPLVMILLVASAISALVGEIINSLIIVIMVLFSVTLDYMQHDRAQKAELALKKSVAQTATVLRDACWSEISVSSIVPGDIIRLDAGNLVPADAELISARDLHVNEAALTGESFPAAKYSPNGKEESSDLSRVFFGSSVVSGNATARVVATGSTTAFGAIAKQLGSKPPETEFERGTRRFGMLITKTVFILVLFVLTTNLYFGRDPIQSLLFAMALAVGLTPEFLPLILTVTLGSGALKMAKRKVIVKHLSAIQNFGSIDVLCSDKTGTITSGDMTMEGYFDALGNTSQKTLRLAYINSAYETGIKNPLDAAILNHTKIDVSAAQKLDELPFDFERKRVSVVVKDSDLLLISKGAPETILTCCTQFESNGDSQQLSDRVLQQINERWQNWSRKGYRVIAVAYKKEQGGRQEWSSADESNLTLAGFITFLDPILPEANDMILALRKDGIKVKILTGDNELVTAHVCSKVGISQKKILRGSEIDRLTPPALAHAVERCSVFVRVSPAQKYKIILALKARGHVVGFLGDGINDAPSLHAADVGISVANATDVAKDAAEIILMERNLTILHEGIMEGRRAFGNVFKYLLMGTSSNFGNMFSMAGASLFLPFLPMLPTQILLNNFLYDLAQVTIPTDNVDASYVKKPHRWNISSIRNFMMFVGPISSLYDFLTFFVLINVFHANEKVFHTGWFIESLATQTLVIFIIRTAGNPFKSRPSAPLTVSTIIVISLGILLPLSPLATALGFTPLPFTFYVFLFVATITYLFLVQLAKGHVLKQM